MGGVRIKVRVWGQERSRLQQSSLLTFAHLLASLEKAGSFSNVFSIQCRKMQVVRCQAQPAWPTEHPAMVPMARCHSSPKLPGLSRSHLLRTVFLSASSISSLALLAPASLAAPEGSVPAAENILDLLSLSMVPPEPVTFPRRSLELNFAVLLMRSGYEAVDDLDFIPMDEFQKQFWKLRAAEYEPYTVQYLPLKIKQGDLTQANYFDFISFAQYATISREIPQGRQVFKEYCEECEDLSKLVQRDPALQDNALLPALHAQLTGDRIYDGLVNGFRGAQYGGPRPCSPGCSFRELVAGVQQVLDIFVGQGFAIRATLSEAVPDASGRGGSFKVQLEGPANLWALQTLAARRSLVYNAYDALTVAAYLRASGLRPQYRLAWTDTTVTEEWKVA